MSPAEFFYRIGNILSDLKHNKLTKHYLELKFYAQEHQNRLLTKHYLCCRDETWRNIKFFQIKNTIEITRCDFLSRYLRMIHMKKKKKGRKKNISVKNDKFFKKSKYCIGSIMFND